MDLHQLDLPALLALQQLLETASVTVAARRLDIPQPNMSRTLRRMRELFDDPLLVPVGRRLEKTARARALVPRVQAALEAMQRLLEPPPAQAPEAETRVVRIACSDYASVVVLQPFLRRLQRRAPGILVRVVPLGVETIDPLARGELDLAIAPRVLVEGIEQFVFKKLFDDRLICVLRPGHPAARGRLTLDAYQRLSHVLVSSARPTPSLVDVALHRLGRTRKVALTVPGFLQALSAVVASDLASALPERLVRAAGRPVQTRKLPLEVEALSLSLIWHPRRTTDPQHRWLRDELAQLGR